MSQNKAYLIPDNHAPGEYRCIKVWIPKDNLYLWQFLTAYSYFGKWVAWERDALKRGKEAAQAWRNAIELTRETLQDDCADCPTEEEMHEITELLNDVIERLAELEDMNITVTQTQCGCGCDGQSTSSTEGIIIPDDFDGTPPVLDNTPVSVTDTQRCRAANYLVEKVIAGARGIGALGAAGTVIALIVSAIATILTWLSPVAGDEVVPTSIFVLIAWQIVTALNAFEDFDLDLFDNLADEMEANRQQIVCDLYTNYTDASTVGGYVSTWIDAQIDSIADEFSLSDDTRQRMKDIVNNLISNYVINWFVEKSASIVPEGYSPPLSCVCTQLEQPALPAGYEWREGVIAEYSQDAETTLLSFSNTGWLYEFNIPTSGTTWSPEMTSVPPALNAGESIVAWTARVYRNATSGGVNDPQNDSVRILSQEDTSDHDFLEVTAADRAALEAQHTYDYVTEKSATDVDDNRVVSHYARVGVSGTPPGEGYAEIVNVLWCIKLP